VAGVPIVEHVMGIYRAQGRFQFLLAVGYRADLFADRYAGRAGVMVVDTGEDTPTGERLRLAAAVVEEDTFHATYGDGLADLDLGALLDTHRRARADLTVTTVPLRSQYGAVVCDEDGRVMAFREKPVLEDHWINGGFFVVERGAIPRWRGDDLEAEVLPALAGAGRLYAYRHRGFWKSMDTYKDRQELNRLADPGPPPWRTAPG